jgi:uncharacterized protein
MSFMPRPFRPARWASGPHAQTLLARALRGTGEPVYQRERIDTPDGDFLDLDWAPEPGPAAPLALVIHGLEGSASRSYVRNVCRELLAGGVRPVAMNLRGCSGEPNRRPRIYHSGGTSDPRFVLETLRDRYPDRAIGGFGFSLGGNILLKLLGEDAGGSRLLDAAVAMSVPYDLAASSVLLQQSRMGRAYSAYFLRSMKQKIVDKRHLLAPLIDMDAALAARTIWAFDDCVTAPLAHFTDAAQYYARSSSAGFLASIEVPTLLLHSLDDPFLPPSAVPRESAEANPNLLLSLQTSGGHVGFLEGVPWHPAFWADEEGARFLAELLSSSRES